MAICRKCGESISDAPGTKSRMNPFTGSVIHEVCPTATTGRLPPPQPPVMVAEQPRPLIQLVYMQDTNPDKIENLAEYVYPGDWEPHEIMAHMVANINSLEGHGNSVNDDGSFWIDGCHYFIMALELAQRKV